MVEVFIGLDDDYVAPSLVVLLLSSIIYIIY